MLTTFLEPRVCSHVWELIEDPDQDFCSVAFLWSESIFRSAICRILSEQGFIRSMSWVIRKWIIRCDESMCTVGFALSRVHFPRTSNFCKKNYHNLFLILPASIKILQKKGEITAKYKWLKWLTTRHKLTILPRNYNIKNSLLSISGLSLHDVAYIVYCLYSG